MGYILLEGGAEFGGQMAEPDRQAIMLAGLWKRQDHALSSQPGRQIQSGAGV